MTFPVYIGVGPLRVHPHALFDLLAYAIGFRLYLRLPQVAAPQELGYQNLFRIIIMQFIDAAAFDVRSVKKTCVHIVHPDGRLIPFDTFNLFYRDDLERTRLEPLRARAALAGV